MRAKTVTIGLHYDCLMTHLDECSANRLTWPGSNGFHRPEEPEMRRRTDGFSVFNPFSAWTGFSLRVGEMLVASAAVIQHRSARIAAAGPAPGARDRREFTRMGQEKLEAAAESMQAMWLRAISANMQLAGWMTQQMLASSTRTLGLAMTPALLWTPGAAIAHALPTQRAWVKQLSGIGAGVAQQGLRPVHARATANARRLVYRPAGLVARKSRGSR